MIKQKVFPSWAQYEQAIYYLSAFNISRDAEDRYDDTYRLEIALAPLPSPKTADVKTIHLYFEGTKNIRINRIDSWNCPLIIINDVSHHQWDGVKYSVEEDTLSMFSFHCKRYHFEEIMQ